MLTPPNEQSREKGITQYNAGDYADAAGAFNNAVRQDPRDYQSHYYLGRTFEAMGSYQQAIESYRTSLAVMSNSLTGRENQTFRLKVLDGLASAIAKGEDRMAQTASLQQKASPTAEDEFVLAKVLRIHGDADSAIAAYAQAASLDPKNLPIAREYGLYLDQLHLEAKARPELVHAYQLNDKINRVDDPQINAALRRAEVVPGPALLAEKDLARPAVPLGPLPENVFAKPEASAAQTGAPATPPASPVHD